MTTLYKTEPHFIQLALEVRGYSLATLSLLSVLVLWSLQWLTRMISKALNNKRVATILQEFDNSVIEGILVLLQPASQVIGDSGGVVDDTKMRIRVRAGASFAELGPLAQHVGVQFLLEGHVSSLGEERFRLKDGQKTHRLFKHVNALLQIHAEVNIGPVETLPDILL